MIYSVVGTGLEKREQAFSWLQTLGTPSAHIYSEQIVSLRPLISATSLFGEKILVHVIQVFDGASSKEEVIRLLPEMQISSTIFIIDEPFADANRMKKLEKFSEKLFDAREEKEKEVDVFTLCSLFARRDKKGAWVEWMKIKDEVSGEQVQGLLWWKMKTIWEDTLSGKPSKFTKEECEMFGEKVLRSSIEAHRGKADLKVELEKIILSI